MDQQKLGEMVNKFLEKFFLDDMMENVFWREMYQYRLRGMVVRNEDDSHS